MLNHITIMGRLTRDPEMRITGSGTSVANFSIANERDFSKDKETDFYDIVAWRKTAEFVTKYFTKGRMIVVDGHLQTNSFTDKNGNNRTKVEIVADNCYFGDAKRDAEGGSYGGATAQNFEQNVGQPTDFSYPYPGQGQQSNFALIDGDDGALPF